MWSTQDRIDTWGSRSACMNPQFIPLRLTRTRDPYPHLRLFCASTAPQTFLLAPLDENIGVVRRACGCGPPLGGPPGHAAADRRRVGRPGPYSLVIEWGLTNWWENGRDELADDGMWGKGSNLLQNLFKCTPRS